MREDIITLLSQKDTQALSLKDIQRKLNIKNKKQLKITLEEMLNDATLYYSSKKEKYLLFEKSSLIKGELIINKYGVGYIKYNGRSILIPKDKINGAIHKDTVIVSYDNDWYYGKVEKVLSHDESNYVAEVILKNNKLYAKVNNRPLIKINSNNHNLIEGHKILVTNEEGKAKVLEVIGHRDDPGIDILSILYDYDFGRKWNSDAIEQLKNIPTFLDEDTINRELLNGRIDLRDKKIITIDCDDTKDIDDGFYIEKLENGNIKLNVVIADVEEYVKEDSPIDIEASNDTTSVYPPGSVDPMLDHKLSNGICSLNPNADRLAMSYEVEIDKNGEIINFKPSTAIINSKKKMCYSNVNKILEEESLIEDYNPFYKELLIAQKLYLQIKSKMERNNLINFNTKEIKVLLNELGESQKLDIRQNRTAENIIEFFMLLINEQITKFLEDNGLPCVYRVDGEPNQEKLRQVFIFANQKGFIKDNELKNKYTASDIQELIKRVDNTRIGVVINKMLIRCMDKAKYSTENIGHYPLGLTIYGQHTSPIRRYTDLINQRILKYFLTHGAKATKKKFNKKYLEKLCKHCSEREIAAKKCEREATEMKIIEYMSHTIGKTYQAVISGINKDGIYILLDNTLESFIKISNLPEDRYEYIENNFTLNGHNYKFQLGDEIEVRLVKTDKDNITAKFNIVSTNKQKINTNKPKTRSRSRKFKR